MYTVRIIFTLLICIILFGCNNKKSNNLSKIDEDTLSAKFYDDNGLLEREGKFLYDTIKVGIWSFYENGKLKNQREYLYNESSEYLNQFWLFDENEEVAGGSFYEINDFKNEYSLGDEIIVEIFTPYKYFSDLDSELFLIYSTKEEFSDEYSNRNEIKYDTIWNAKKSYPSQFKNNDNKFYITFAIEPKKIGPYKLSGILIEQGEDFSANDSIIRYREMFLEIAFKVKDTIN